MDFGGLYFITDSKLSLAGDVEDVEAALAVGVKVVQYREKELPTREMIEVAAELRELTSQAGALLLINDRVDVAQAARADGVHLGQDDMSLKKARELLGEEAVIGVTVHNLKEAVEAEKDGADYLGLSPIFSTSTKSDAGEPAGVKLIKEVKARVKLPCVAIGGINEENLGEVLSAGADGVCMISATVGKDDVEATVKRILEKIADAKNKG